MAIYYQTLFKTNLKCLSGAFLLFVINYTLKLCFLFSNVSKGLVRFIDMVMIRLPPLFHFLKRLHVYINNLKQIDYAAKRTVSAILFKNTLKCTQIQTCHE